MKVLFAINNENVSEEIVKKYQKDYREIISYKNVYYFNAIIKEMQRDRSYDRIVISEDLEPFANNNYDTIDKFLFEKLDNISDEAAESNERDAQIILICSDRRSKSDSLLVKLFGIGIYSAIIGKDRSIEEVCRLINTPRTKKDAKLYYRIDSEDVSYQAENDTDVNENEIQSILKHYKSLGKNDDKYVESFNNIASQYTDAQLRIIIKFLPLNVKAVLEARSPKYQQIVMFGDKQYKKKNTANIVNPNQQYQEVKTKKNVTTVDSSLKIDALEKRVTNPFTGKPIVIPSVVKSEKTAKVERKLKDLEDDETYLRDTNNMRNTQNMTQTSEIEKDFKPIEELNERIVKGPQYSAAEEYDTNTITEPTRRGRGRPKKFAEEPSFADNNNQDGNLNDPVKKGRGRPKKAKQEDEPVNLFGIAQEDDEQILPGIEDSDSTENEDTILPGLGNSYTDTQTNNYINSTRENITRQESKDILQSNRSYNSEDYVNSNYRNNTYSANETDRDIEEYSTNRSSFDTSSLISGDRKIAAFVGSAKNGTSFTVNNLAALFVSMGISTAILDLTENKNSFFIYTKNEENLRKTAYDSIPKLKTGRAEGVKVNKYLSVYTGLPGEYPEREDIDDVLSTLVNNYDLVLLDCDFNTPSDYFARSQEIYLVQSMDVLTIQPLTAFMRDLKNKGELKPEKLRIVINKATKIRGLNEKVLIGGMAYYNSPSMSFMTELFNKENAKYCMIPLDVNTYISYLEGMVSCEISLDHYSKIFIQSLKDLAAMVYPLVNKQSYRPREIRGSANTANNGYFSQGMNSTLEKMNRMKNGY